MDWDPMDLSGISERNAKEVITLQKRKLSLLSSYSRDVTYGFRATSLELRTMERAMWRLLVLWLALRSQ